MDNIAKLSKNPLSNFELADNAAAAVDLARRGFAVFPIYFRADREEWTPNTGWQANACADPGVVEGWWRSYPDARVGLLTGPRTGLTVLDIDMKNGHDGLAALRALGNDLDASPVRVRTPSGGWHLFFQYDPECGDSTSKIGDGIDTKGHLNGSYVVAPGSLKGASRYAPEGALLGTVPLPPYPAALRPPRPPERPPVAPLTAATDEQKEWAAVRLARLAEDLAGSAEGSRNAELNAAAAWAGGAAAHGFITFEQVESALLPAALECGLKRIEARGTIKSGFKFGLKAPIGDFPHDLDVQGMLNGLDDPDDSENLAWLDAMLPPAAAREKTKEAAAPFFIDVSTWEGQPAPAREWLVPDVIPMATVTALYGDGGNGKSLLALQLAAAVATGTPWVGLPTRRGTALALMAEDDEFELRRRIRDVTVPLGGEPTGALFVRDAVGDGPLVDLDPRKGIVPNRLYAQFKKAIADAQPALVVVDTLGALFPGNENDRAQATAFVRLLKGLAAVNGAAVLLIAHPSRAGMTTGSGDSGSTAWNGSVRARLYFDKVLTDGVELDPSRRRLTLKKSNYGPRGLDLLVTWDGESMCPQAAARSSWPKKAKRWLGRRSFSF